MTQARRTWAILGLMAWPASAWANAGTPLIWATMLHLIFGNALLGVIEGLLLGWIFRVPLSKAIVLLIVANYVSAWAGGVLITNEFAGWVDLTIENAGVWFPGFMVAAFLITLVIEFPFFWFPMRRSRHAIRRAAVATLLIHGFSYLLLLGWYGGASRTSLLDEVAVVPAEALNLPPGHALYFLPREGGGVVRTEIDGTNPQRIAEGADGSGANDRLFARVGEAGRFDLWRLRTSAESGGDREELVRPGFSARASLDFRTVEPGGKPVDTAGNVGPVSKLARTSEWTVETGGYATEGILAGPPEDPGRFRWGMDTPMASWRVRNGTHLEGDFVIFQLGKDQICALDLRGRRIALIARGRGPLVAEKLP